MSLNNHECDHSQITGQVSITPETTKLYNNVAISLPAEPETIIENEDGTTSTIRASSITFFGNSDSARIRFYSDGDTRNEDTIKLSSCLEIATADNGTEPIYCRQYIFTNDPTKKLYYQIYNTLTLFDYDGTTSIPRALYIYDSTTGKHINVAATLKAIAGDKIVYKEG